MDGLTDKDGLKKIGFKRFFEACADKAKENNYILFGIQFAKECWGDDNPNQNYARLGRATNCEHSDVEGDFYQIGGEWSNYIYRAKPSEWKKLFLNKRNITNIILR